MAQFYTLEEAARVLGMSPEDLKQKAQHREVRAFMDSGSWQFRVADIDELARRRGLGSDPELVLSDHDIEVGDGSGSGSDELDLSEFQLGTNKADLSSRTADLTSQSESDDDQDVQFDDLSLPPGPLSTSSSTIIGMKPGNRLPTDSDVRLVPDQPPRRDKDSMVRLKIDEPIPHPTSQSDVALGGIFPDSTSNSDVVLGGNAIEPPVGPRPSDSDVTLVNDDPSLLDIHAFQAVDEGLTGRPGSSSEIFAADADDASEVGSSDFELMPSTDIAAALQPESGSDFELTALDASDEFEATPLTGPSDSDVTAAQPSASGINLARPSDSGINLQSVGGFDLSQADSIELAPLDEDEPVRPGSRPSSKPAPKRSPPKSAPKVVAAKQDPNSATVMPGVIPADPGATSMGLTEKDIFEDTDFSLEVDALDSDHDDRTVQLDRSSDFDLEESDSASEVFALDEDEVDQNAATAMGAAVADDESGEFAADDEGGSGEMSSGWDVESEGASSAAAMATPSPVGGVGARLVPAGPQAEWGGIWVGLLGFTSALVFVSMIFSIDLVKNLYEYNGGGPASGLINSISSMFK